MKQHSKRLYKNKILKCFIFYLLFLLTAGCGYKPSSHAISHIFEDTVYLEVLVDKIEPENAPFIKDELSRLVYQRFKGRVAGKEEAKSYIRVRYDGSTFTPLAYKNGYVVRYRANIRVQFDMLNKEGRVKKNINTVHEADIQASSLTSSTLRTEAIRKGLQKALDEFLAYVSARGVLKAESIKR